MSKRTDAHRPGAIIPSDYSYVLGYALPSVVDGWPCPPINVDLVVALQHSEKFAHTGDLGKCSVCGARYIEGQVWKHEPTGEHIHIGRDCAAKYELLADSPEFNAAFEAARAGAARAAQAEINRKARAAFLGQHPGLEEALKVEHSIIQDIAGKFRTYCELSEKQIALVFKIAGETSERAARPAEQHVTAPVSEKRQTFTGVIVSAKSQDGFHGSTVYKMTVKVTTPAGTWLAWGTAPAALIEQFPCGDNGRLHMMRGATVEITATLEAGREPHFVFMKRPKGKVVSLPEATAAVLATEQARAAEIEAMRAAADLRDAEQAREVAA